MPKRLRSSSRWPLALVVAVVLSVGSGWSVHPPQEDLRLDPALSLALDGEYEAALRLFEQMIAEDPEDPRFHYFAGICRLFLGENALAIHELAEAVKLKAAFPESYYWLAKAYFEEDRDIEACRVIQEGLTAFPTNKKLKVLAESFQLRCLAEEEPQ